jgi:hypothetical protein
MSVDTQLLKKIEIKNATEVREDALTDFYQEMYPKRGEFLKKHWRWLYRVDQFSGAQPPLVALLDGNVIGHVAPIPIVLKKGRQEKLAAWGVDGGVLVPYRKSGIGFKLMEIWTQQYPIVLGFCTVALFRILVKQGWSPRMTTCSLQLPLRPDRHPRFQKGLCMAPLRLAGCGWNLFARLVTMARMEGCKKLKAIPLSPQRLENWDLLHHPKEFRDPIHVARSADFMRWRLLNSPFREQYQILELGDSDVAAVVRTFQSGGLRRAQIVAISGNASDRGTLYRFFGGIVAWALEQDVDLIKMINSDPEVVRVAQRWLPKKAVQRFVCYCHDAKDEEMMQSADHIWELIDYDFDFLT